MTKFYSLPFSKLGALTLLISVVFFTGRLNATHLIGGNISYTYGGADPNAQGNTLYTLTFQAYLDCNSNNWNPGSPGGFPEDPITLGVYEGGIEDSLLTREQTMQMTVAGFDIIEPKLPAGCTFSIPTCVALVEYTGTISLPPSAEGYHIMYDRCCRPGGITNLLNSGSQTLTYKCFIPSEENSTNLLPNNSAFFTDTLAAFICLNDTATIPNSAFDVDGDSIAYRLVTPFEGLTTQANPVPNWGGPGYVTYPNPPPSITWAPGHNETQKFGPTGFQSINPSNGNTRFMADVAGTYVATVEIEEYRNGRLISLTRRDMQLLVVTCPDNDAPNLDTTNLDSIALTPEDYAVNAGDSFCIDLTYSDPDGDSVFLTASGSIFDTALVNPTPVILTPVEGDSVISTQLCWNTICEQGRTEPYRFTVAVTDNGCPPLTTYQNFSITVRPFSVGEIQGADTICTGAGPSTYSVDSVGDASYVWQATNGTIIGPDTNSSVVVDWSLGAGTLSAVITNATGCIDSVSTPVFVSEVTAAAGPDTFICIGDSVQIGAGALNAGETAVWSPLNNISNPDSNFTFVQPDSTTIYVVTVSDSVGCVASDSAEVTVFSPAIADLEPAYYLCPGDTLEINNNIDSVLWTPNYFISGESDSTTRFFPDMDTTYFVAFVDSNGCSDEDSIHITVNPVVPTDAGPDQEVCEGIQLTLGGDPTSLPPVNYQWTPSGDLSDDTIPNPTLTPPPGVYTYTIETSSDTCSGIDSVTVTVNATPEINLSDDTTICAYDSIQITAEIISGSGDFTWTNGNVMNDSTSLTPLAAPLTRTVFQFNINDSNDCSAGDSIVVDVNPIPEADAGIAPQLCKFEEAVLGPDSANPELDYRWSPATYLNGVNTPNPTTRPRGPVIYILEVIDSVNCRAFDTIDLNILNLNDGFDSLICAGNEISLNLFAEGGNEPYDFFINPENGVDDPSSPQTVIRPNETTIYEVVVVDSNDCADTAEVTLNVAPTGAAQPGYDFKPGCNENMIVFENRNPFSTGNELWIINGDTQFFEYPRDSIMYNLGQPLDVQLVTRTDLNCVDTARLTIEGRDFEGILDLHMPNVFTPNGDEINDYFEFLGNRNLIDCIEMQVFNRWGNLIFESTPGNASWDGRNFSGEPVPEGVYFYIIEVNGIIRKGSVQLLR